VPVPTAEPDPEPVLAPSPPAASVAPTAPVDAAEADSPVRLLPGETVLLETFDADSRHLDVSALLAPGADLTALARSLVVDVRADGSIQVSVGSARLVVTRLAGELTAEDVIARASSGSPDVA